MLFFDDLMFVHAGIPRDADIKAQAHRPRGAQRSRPPLPDAVERSVDGRLHPRRSAGAERAVPVRQAPVRGVHAAARLLDDGPRPREGRRRVPARCTATIASLLTLFSAGGADNNDLPPDSSYRTVTPMAATIRLEDGTAQVTPWLIDYERFNDPQAQPVLRVAARDRAQGRLSCGRVYLVALRAMTRCTAGSRTTSPRGSPHTTPAPARATRAAAARSSVVLIRRCRDKRGALRLEYAIKQLPRTAKQALVDEPARIAAIARRVQRARRRAADET